MLALEQGSDASTSLSQQVIRQRIRPTKPPTASSGRTNRPSLDHSDTDRVVFGCGMAMLSAVTTAVTRWQLGALRDDQRGSPQKYATLLSSLRYAPRPGSAARCWCPVVVCVVVAAAVSSAPAGGDHDRVRVLKRMPTFQLVLLLFGHSPHQGFIISGSETLGTE